MFHDGGNTITNGDSGSLVHVFPAGTLLLLTKNESGAYLYSDLTPQSPQSGTLSRGQGLITDVFPDFASERLSMLLNDASEMDCGSCFYAFLHDETGHHLIPLTVCRIQGEIFVVVIGEEAPAAHTHIISHEPGEIDSELPDIVSRIDPEKNIISTTPASERYFGMSSFSVAGHPYFEFIHPDDHESLGETLSLLCNDVKMVRGRYRLRNEKGGFRWVETEFCGVFHPTDGYLREILLSTHDVDALIRAGEAARRTTEKLNLMNSGVRHDVLNLIMGFQGYLDILFEIVADEEAQLLLHKEKEISERIKRLVDMTRKFQGVGIKPPGWIDVMLVVGKIFSRHEYTGKFTGHISLDGVFIYADYMFEHVIDELLANSLAFATSSDDVVITLSSEVTDEGLVIAFEDNGPGIRDEDKESIFRRSQVGRSGYGLYLVTEILDITEIRIRESGTFQKGARFEMIIPPDGYRITRPYSDSLPQLSSAGQESH